ncbi:hypothetical protein ACFX15_002975 [Malus domestica]
MGFQRLKMRAQKSKKHRFQISKSASFLKSWACSQSTDSRYRRAPAFSKVGLAHKPPIPDIEECQLSQPRQHPSHVNAALRKSRAVCRSADSNHLSLSASSTLVTCRESFAEITGSLSKRRFQPSVFLSLVSFEEITGNLSTISVEVENT